MKGDTYLRYLKLFPTKRPNLVLWSHLIMWLAALGINLYAVGKNYDTSLWFWALSFLFSVWSLAAIGFWVKLIISKRAIDKLLKV